MKVARPADAKTTGLLMLIALKELWPDEVVRLQTIAELTLGQMSPIFPSMADTGSWISAPRGATRGDSFEVRVRKSGGVDKSSGRTAARQKKGDWFVLEQFRSSSGRAGSTRAGKGSEERADRAATQFGRWAVGKGRRGRRVALVANWMELGCRNDA